MAFAEDRVAGLDCFVRTAAFIGAAGIYLRGNTRPSKKLAPRHSRYSPLNRSAVQRHSIGCCYSRLKHFRRVVIRDDNTARNVLAAACRPASLVGIR